MVKPRRFDFVRVIAQLEQPRKFAIKPAAILADGGGEHSREMGPFRPACLGTRFAELRRRAIGKDLADEPPAVHTAPAAQEEPALAIAIPTAFLNTLGLAALDVFAAA
jgi:hypothetical protein